MIWFCLILIAAISWGLTGLLRQYALSHSLIDIPNSRSSHSVPTARGGGVAIVFSFLVGMGLLWFFDFITFHTLLVFGGSGVLVSLIGFIDDHRHIAAGWRLMAHFVAAIWGLYWLNGLPSLVFFGIETSLGWFGNLLAVIYLVWLLNLYNFMDGIDGIAAIETMTVCFGGVILFLLGDFGTLLNQLPVLFLLAATAGFLIWNFPPARIFMGDAGSGFVGLLLGLFSVAAAHVDQSLLWGWIILLGAFIVDATVTLIRRMLKGKAFYVAHRSHAYQYLSRRWAAHKPVSLAYGVINLLWLLPIAALVVLGFVEGLLGIFIAYLPLVALAFLLKAGDEYSQEV